MLARVSFFISHTHRLHALDEFEGMGKLASLLALVGVEIERASERANEREKIVCRRT